MRRIDSTWVHCTASGWGTVEEIRRWHVEGRGWRDIGYHFLIPNQFPTYASLKDGRPNYPGDGEICIGRPIQMSGAHVRGENHHSVGIALVGENRFTVKQFFALAVLVEAIERKFHRPGGGKIRVFGHYEYWTRRNRPRAKTCPNFDMDWFREWLKKLREGDSCIFPDGVSLGV